MAVGTSRIVSPNLHRLFTVFAECVARIGPHGAGSISGQRLVWSRNRWFETYIWRSLMKWTRWAFCLSVGLCFSLASAAHAVVKINELYVGPEDRTPGDDGHGREFFELLSTTPNESLAGLWLLEINGESLDAGIVEQALNLGAIPTPQTGANGLFLWRDEKVDGQDLVPAPHPDTVIHYADFAGDGLQNGDNATYLLVQNFTGMLGDDLDFVGGGGDGDGVLDTLPWGAVIDAVGVKEAETDGYSYAGAFGGAHMTELSFGPDAFSLLPSSGLWFMFDSGNGEEDPRYYGPFFASDGTDYGLQGGAPVPITVASQYFLTPGSANSELVPEPAAVCLLLFGVTGVLACRRGR